MTGPRHAPAPADATPPHPDARVPAPGPDARGPAPCNPTPVTDTVDERFPRSARVLARAEFDRVFAEGRRGATPLLAVHWLRNDDPPRLGLAVSRKVDARAVGRNRIKRIVRDAFRRSRSRLAPGSYVVVARAAAAAATAAAVREAFDSALRRLGALPPPDAVGTMPGSPNAPAAPPAARAGRSRLPPDSPRR